MVSTDEIMEDFLNVPGIEAVIAVDKDGLILGSAAKNKEENDTNDLESLGAVASGVISSIEFLVDKEFKKGNLEQIVLEYENGKVIIQHINSNIILAIFITKEAKLGIVRLMSKRKKNNIIEAFS